MEAEAESHRPHTYRIWLRPAAASHDCRRLEVALVDPGPALKVFV